MVKFIGAVLISLALLTVQAADPVFAQGKEKDLGQEDGIKYHTVTTKEGLSFTVPEDMPIVNRNGIVAPVPFEEYIYGKLNKLNSRLKSVEARLDQVERRKRG